MKLHEIKSLIDAVCPVGRINSNGEIEFLPEATPTQRAAAQALMGANLPNLVP